MIGTECELYGLLSGCVVDCPVLQRRECEIQKQVEETLGMTEKIISHPSTPEYRNGWERIFGVSYSSLKKGDIVFCASIDRDVVFVLFDIDGMNALVRDFRGDYWRVKLEELKERREH